MPQTRYLDICHTTTFLIWHTVSFPWNFCTVKVYTHILLPYLICSVNLFLLFPRCKDITFFSRLHKLFLKILEEGFLCFIFKDSVPSLYKSNNDPAISKYYSGKEKFDFFFLNMALSLNHRRDIITTLFPIREKDERFTNNLLIT